jgi:hypothetical protein
MFGSTVKIMGWITIVFVRCERRFHGKRDRIDPLNWTRQRFHVARFFEVALGESALFPFGRTDIFSEYSQEPCRRTNIV